MNLLAVIDVETTGLNPYRHDRVHKPKGQRSMEINGIAHVILTVSNFDAVVPFYEKLLPFLGMKRMFKGEEFLYYLGARKGLGISKCDERYRREQFVQR